jgi:thiamine biosynthesis lipoprotein ApbE
MDDKMITANELQAALDEEIQAMFQEVASAMNHARAGSIIADSEEPVRDANAKFKQKVYQKALDLLQQKQGAFSPSAEAEKQGQQIGHAPDD